MVWKKATPLGYQLHLIVQFHLLRKCGLLAHTSAPKNFLVAYGL